MTATSATPDLLPIPDGDFDAYLFDMDGTLADSMSLHLVTWQQAAREFGADFPVDLFWQWGGIPLPKTVEMLNERFGYTMDPVTVVHRKEQLYLEKLAEVTPIANVVAHVTAQHGRSLIAGQDRLKLAVVSGSPRLTIIKTLTALGLIDYFDTLVGGEDYTHGKPDPEPFLTAAKRLGVDPAKCLVFEDAEAGIASAKAAGMSWVRVPVPQVATV